MEHMYSINDLAVMTGLSTRTLRNYLKLGLLEGEKSDGAWQFSEEAVSGFFQNEMVKASLQAKRNALVFDFMADNRKRRNEACVILDLPAGREEAKEVSDFFCQAVNESRNVELSFHFENGNVRVILKGSEETVAAIMKQYYE